MNTEMKEQIDNLSKTFERNKDVSIDNSKDIEVDLNISSRQRITVNEVNQSKQEISKQEIKAPSNEKETSMNK